MFFRPITLATLGLMLGSGLMAGFFFAFSTTVMPALARLSAPQGIAAMNSINVVVVQSRWFMGAFLGTALASLVVAAISLGAWSTPPALLRIAGCLLYVIGAFGVTIACNVPRNDALAAVTPESAEAVSAWSSYLVEWTFWNHVRTVAGAGALVLLVLSLVAASAAE
jgi:uncharacterized membrane protein